MVSVRGLAAARIAGFALALLAAIVAPLFGAYWLLVFSLAVVYVLAALSLVVLTGWSGQLNLHVASLGLGWGSYAAFALVSQGVPAGWALLTAGVVAAPFAGIIALVAIRFRGLELAVATLAMGLIFERLFFRNIAKMLSQASADVSTPFASSFVSMPKPSVFGIDASTDKAFFWFCMVVAALVFFLVGNVGRSGTGRTLRALRERELTAETLGIPVMRYRIGIFVASIAIAVTAGGLFASLKGGIAPDSFNLNLSFQLLAAVVIGGIYSPGGAVVGGSLAALLPQLITGEWLFVVFGAGMVLALWRFPKGLAGGIAGLLLRPGAHAGDTSPAPFTAAIPASVDGELGAVDPVRRAYRTKLDRHVRPSSLRVEGMRIRFGGVVALDGVSLHVSQGEICALIGPNGAGKSTLFNCIGGVLTPDEGRIYFDGRDVTELPAHRRAALGMGRTFQTVEVFRGLTVLENLTTAGYLSRRTGVFSEALLLPSARRSERLLEGRAREVAATLGLDRVAGRYPGELPLGLLRVLEVGMAIVPRPRALLLDEPGAGLDANETAALASLIARVRTAYDVSVLLVEHDMSMVARLADHVYVLDFGAIIAEGTPSQVRNNPLVLERYLGRDLAAPSGSGRGRRRAHA
ncbi:MAG: ABC transporter permease subunit [Actinomycetota bacterium]